MDALLLPALIILILVIIGLTIWLALYFTGTKDRRSASRPPTAMDTRHSALKQPLLSIDKNERGLWEVHVHGTHYPALGDVPDETTRAQLVDALKILAVFSRDYLRKRPQQTPPVPTPANAGVYPVPPPTLTVIPPAEQLKIPSGRPSLMPQINLAREIGDILEEMQRHRPSLANRSIRLRNAQDGGVNFIVDGQRYRDVQDIPALEVQALIRAATEAWERR